MHTDFIFTFIALLSCFTIVFGADTTKKALSTDVPHWPAKEYEELHRDLFRKYLEIQAKDENQLIVDWADLRIELPQSVVEGLRLVRLLTAEKESNELMTMLAKRRATSPNNDLIHQAVNSLISGDAVAVAEWWTTMGRQTMSTQFSVCHQVDRIVLTAQQWLAYVEKRVPADTKKTQEIRDLVDVCAAAFRRDLDGEFKTVALEFYRGKVIWKETS